MTSFSRGMFYQITSLKAMATANNKIRNLQFWYPNIPRKLIMDRRLSIQAKYVYMYMSCQAETFEFFLEPMAKDMDIDVRTLSKYMKELIKIGWITKGKQNYVNGRWRAVNYTLETSPKSPKEEKTDIQKTDVSKTDVSKCADKYNSNTSITIKQDSSINTPISNDNDEKRLSNDNHKEDYSDDFLEFWKAYGYSKDKGTTYKRWKKLSVKDRKEALEALPEYFADCERNKRNKQYPATYLNKRTWEDDFSEQEKEEESDGIIDNRYNDVQFRKQQEWMQRNTPKIADKITLKMMNWFRERSFCDGNTLRERLIELNEVYDGSDIVELFKVMYLT